MYSVVVICITWLQINILQIFDICFTCAHCRLMWLGPSTFPYLVPLRFHWIAASAVRYRWTWINVSVVRYHWVWSVVHQPLLSLLPTCRAHHHSHLVILSSLHPHEHHYHHHHHHHYNHHLVEVSSIHGCYYFWFLVNILNHCFNFMYIILKYRVCVCVCVCVCVRVCVCACVCVCRQRRDTKLTTVPVCYLWM